jgi:hypothetical protein
MAATNCTANVSRKHVYAYSNSGATTLANRVAALGFGIVPRESTIKAQGVNGLIFSKAEDYVADKIACSGAVNWEVRPNSLRWFLPLVFGTAFSANVIKLGPSCPFFRVGHLDNQLEDVTTFVDCATSRLTFASSSSGGSILTANHEIEASNYTTGATSTWPAGLNLSSQQPLVHSQSSLTINGNPVRFNDVQLIIDYGLMADEYYNSPTREDFPSDGVNVQLVFTCKYDTTNERALTNLTGPVAASLRYQNAANTMSALFELPALTQMERTKPAIGGRGSRVTQQFTFEAHLAAGADETTDSCLSVTLDDTP